MKRLLSCLLLFSSVTVSAQPMDTLSRLDQLFSRWNNATPGVAIAIQRGDRIIYNKAFGLADLEHNVPNTTETIFESGSVAKQFTATSILMLVAAGKLNLQDDVRKFVPELPVYEAPITIQHLLNHTSGLKDWGSVGSLSGWPRTSRIYTQDLALQIMSRQKSLNFKPGAQYSYSNSNYSLLVTIVERVSKKTLAQFTDSVFFKPLGMAHTQWRDNFRTVVPHRAIAYTGRENNYLQLMPFEHVHGHGGLLTTTGDLLKWNKLLETKQIVGEKVAAWRIQRGRLNDGTEISYAAGLFIGEVNGFTEISHSGATAGYRAWLACYPQKKLSVAILSNDASFRNVPSQVAEIFLGKEVVARSNEPNHFVELNEAEMKSWAGYYKSVTDADVFSIDYRDQAVFSNHHALKILHKDTLYLDHLYWIRTSSNDLILKTPGESRKYVRVQAPDVRKETLQSLAGTYVSEEAEATYHIKFENDALKVHLLPWPPQPLTPTHLLGFRDEEDKAYEFIRDKKGKVVGLEVSTGRALRVPFRKVN
jgi:CubicO group peptidase (beta-lactamase class C family)